MMGQHSEVMTHLKSQRRSDGDGSSSSYNNMVQRNAFKKALRDTFTRSVEGALTPYLFYDPPTPKKATKGMWGSEDEVAVGADAWDLHISQSTSHGEQRKENEYQFVEGDVEILQYAISKGLISKLPAPVNYYGYGPGGTLAVQAKDCVLIEEILNQRGDHFIGTFNAVDINRRYARDAAIEVHERFDLTCNGITGDFMEGNISLGPKDGNTSLIAVFGGPIANAPKVVNGASSKEKAGEYLYKLTRQHGLGTHLIMTVDAEANEGKLLRDYKKTRPFEAFVLSFFPRAINEGLIRNEDYDVFRHWELQTEFNKEDSCVELIAHCKEGHDIELEDGKYPVKTGENFTVIRSNKWGLKDLREILNTGGYRDIEIYDLPHNSRKLITATWYNGLKMAP